MYRYIWLVPILPLLGATINGLLGRKFRFSEPLIGGIAVGSVALSFLISLAAVYSYGFGSNSVWPNAYVTSKDGNSFNWIPGGAVNINLGSEARQSVELDKERQKKLAATTPEERARPQAFAIATFDSTWASLCFQCSCW